MVGLADLVVDVVETGRTLQENGLVELEEIAVCWATLIVNRVAHRLRLAETRALLGKIETMILPPDAETHPTAPSGTGCPELVRGGS